MIAQQNLIAWRAHAPWPDDGQVEQDYLLSCAVAAIFQDHFLRQHVAMRGGTVLHKAHLAPAARYSEDIDLVLITDRPPGHISRTRSGRQDWNERRRVAQSPVCADGLCQEVYAFTPLGRA